MDARLMSKCIGADNGLVGLHHNAGNHGNQAAGWVNKFRLNRTLQS